jgi:hypothetical protein
LVLLRLNASVTSLIHFSFSEPYGKTSSRDPRGAAVGASAGEGACFLQPDVRTVANNRTKESPRAIENTGALLRTGALSALLDL